MPVFIQNYRVLLYLLISLLFVFPASAEKTGLTSQLFSEVSCERLKDALSKQGWRGELTSEGDILLWPPGSQSHSPIAESPAETKTQAATTSPLLDALQETLENRGWRIERSKNGEVLLWPPEHKTIAESSSKNDVALKSASETPPANTPDFNEMRSALESRRWRIETEASGNLLLLPDDSDNTDSKIPAVSKRQTNPSPADKILFQDTDMDHIPDGVDLCPQTKPGTRITSTGCEAAETLVLEGVNFLSGSAELTDQAKLLLDQLTSRLLNHPKLKFKVTGHTDSVGRSGSNLKLSKQRAVSVANYLTMNKINPRNIEPIGAGETKPVSTNKTRLGRAKNRRVELQLEKYHD